MNSMLEALPICHLRDPFQSPLWNILHNNYEEFKANYDRSYQRVRLLLAGRRDKSVP